MTERTTSGLLAQWAAEWSPCRTYRYTLERTWDQNKKTLCFLMLNPSTATEEKNDPTNRRTMGFAQRWGYGKVLVLNLFAFRATDPRDMKKAEEPIGPENDEVITRVASESDLVICAWGVHGRYRDRDLDVCALLKERVTTPIHCLGYTKNGDPRHPLYVPAATPSRKFKPRDA